MNHVALTRAALALFEDTEQARRLTTVHLFADLDLERVLRGPRKGQDLGEALNAELLALERYGGCALLHSSVIHPWWTLWRPVRWLRLELTPPASGSPEP